MNNENLLPVILLGLLSKSGQISGNTEDIARSAEMLRMAKPYFQNTHKEALSKTENILEALYSINKLTKGEYRKDDSYQRSFYDVEDKHVGILKAVRPHLKGKGKETIERVLTVDDRIKKLKNTSQSNRNILEDFENLTDILEAIQKDKGSEVRNMLQKVKMMVEIMGQ